MNGISENLHLSVDLGRNLVGLHDILSPCPRTLKVIDFTIPLYDETLLWLPLAGLYYELEAMAGHNMLEILSFEVSVGGYETEGLIPKCGEGTGQTWVV